MCLHATAYSSRSFEPLMRALGSSRHVLAIDLPGYGDSDPPTVPLEPGEAPPTIDDPHAPGIHGPLIL